MIPVSMAQRAVMKPAVIMAVEGKWAAQKCCGEKEKGYDTNPALGGQGSCSTPRSWAARQKTKGEPNAAWPRARFRANRLTEKKPN
jgi:hypothetical protein